MIHMIEHALLHGLEDTVRLLPFLFLTYLGMEYLENKAGDKALAILAKTGKKGPIIGGVLGVIPQCGFSAVAANLYAGGVVTVGTMAAVFLSSSDEMIPILISGKAKTQEIVFIVITKMVIGILAGLLVDFTIRRMNKGRQKGLLIHEMCERQHCHCCEGNIFKSAFIHMIKIAAFIYVILVGICLVSELVGMEQLVGTASAYPLLSILIVGLLGLIPNCAISVAITTLYLEGVLSFGAMLTGLLACSGVGTIVLFKMNRPWKKNVIIIAGIYCISVAAGTIASLLL